MNKPVRILIPMAAALLLASCSTGISTCDCPSQSSEAKTSEATKSQEATSEEVASTEERESSEDLSEESSIAPLPERKISVAKADSRFVFTTYTGQGSSDLVTYHHADFGEVPYVEFGQYINALVSNGVISYGKAEKLGEHLYSLTAKGIVILTINPETDILTVKNFDYVSVSSNVNNHGVYWDFGTANDDPASCVHSSYKSTTIGEVVDEVYDMGAYHFDFVEEEDMLYVPFQPISSLLLRTAPCDLLYNGSDFFISTSLSDKVATMLPSAYASFYSTKDTFSLNNATYSKVDPVGEEAGRYFAPNAEGDGAGIAFTLEKDGTAHLRNVSSSGEEGGEPLSLPYTLTYEVQEDGTLVTGNLTAGGPEANFNWKIPSTETYFLSKNRDSSIASHTLDMLRFTYEELYGLKEDLFEKNEVRSFDELIEKANLKEKLLSNDSLNYDEALAELLMKYVDDCHTSYSGRSVFSGLPKADHIMDYANNVTGPRRSGLLEKLSTYKAKRTEVMTSIDPMYEDSNKQQGVFFEGKTAVIRYDSFDHNGIIYNLNANPLATDDPSLAFQTSTPDGIYLSVEEIKKHSEVENVVIDLTCNGGGATLTLPYIAGLWSDDPEIIYQDVKTGLIRDFHYEVDLNRNGVFFEEEDTLMGKYNIFLLTSNFSFSCANALASSAYTQGVRIIGERSGGGACPVATFGDGSGSVFNSSMASWMNYRDKEGNVVYNEGGVPIEEGCALGLDSWYDLSALDSFVSNLN